MKLYVRPSMMLTIPVIVAVKAESFVMRVIQFLYLLNSLLCVYVRVILSRILNVKTDFSASEWNF